MELNQKAWNTYLQGWFSPLWFLELFGSLTSQSRLEYVGISRWLCLQVSDAQNEGFMVSFSLPLVFSRRCEHCSYHLQLSSTILEYTTCFATTFLPCHLLPFVHVRCVFLPKKHKDHSNAFWVADEVCPFGSRPWMVESTDVDVHMEQMGGKRALSSMLFVRVRSCCAICIYLFILCLFNLFTIFTDWWDGFIKIDQRWLEYTVWCRFLPCRVDYGVVCCSLCPQLLLNLLLCPPSSGEASSEVFLRPNITTDSLVNWQTGNRIQWFCNGCASSYAICFAAPNFNQ